MKTLRVKSVNGDTSFQDVTLKVHSIDFIPIVEIDLEQIGKSNKENTWRYEGFVIKNKNTIVELSRYLNAQNLYSVEFTDEKKEIIVKFKVNQGNYKSKDNDGTLKIVGQGIKVLTKSRIEVKYGYAIALRIATYEVQKNSYIDFFASDYSDGILDKQGLTNIHCGRIEIVGTIKTQEIDEKIKQTITNAPDPKWNGEFQWSSKYLIKLRTDNSFIIQMRIFSKATDNTKKIWKEAIENKWNYKFKLKITQNGMTKFYNLIFKIKWTGISNSHYIVIKNGISKQGTYGLNKTTSMTDWGENDTIDITHEFGHMLGNKDEYFTVDGIAYGINRQYNKGIMNNPKGNPNPNNFEKIRQNIAKMLNINEKFCEIIKEQI